MQAGYDLLQFYKDLAVSGLNACGTMLVSSMQEGDIHGFQKR